MLFGWMLEQFLNDGLVRLKSRLPALKLHLVDKQVFERAHTVEAVA
jgi:hypothetical protein